MNKLQENYKRFFKEDISVKEYFGNDRIKNIIDFLDIAEDKVSNDADYVRICAIAGSLNLNEKTARHTIENFLNINDYNSLSELLNPLLDLSSSDLEQLLFDIFKLN